MTFCSCHSFFIRKNYLWQSSCIFASCLYLCGLLLIEQVLRQQQDTARQKHVLQAMQCDMKTRAWDTPRYSTQRYSTQPNTRCLALPSRRGVSFHSFERHLWWLPGGSGPACGCSDRRRGTSQRVQAMSRITAGSQARPGIFLSIPGALLPSQLHAPQDVYAISDPSYLRHLIQKHRLHAAHTAQHSTASDGWHMREGGTREYA